LRLGSHLILLRISVTVPQNTRSVALTNLQTLMSSKNVIARYNEKYKNFEAVLCEQYQAP